MSTRGEEAQKRGLQSAMKAVARMEGKGEPKIGVDELLSVVERFGVSPAGLEKIRAVLQEEKLDGDEGPFLANFYSGLPETKVQAFERTAKDVFDVKYAIGTSSGTGALHAAFVAVGVGPGTEVICPAIGFMATAAAVVQARGVPVFCDVDSSLAMDPASIDELVTERTVALAPTHVMGSVCNMDEIMKAASRHGLKVVEDCAQSCGAEFGGRHVGTIGDMGAFSISAYKIVGGGEGGLLLADDRTLWERASQIVETGGLWRPDRFAEPRYERELFCGTNYRMSELEAAVDVVQLQKVTGVVRRFRGVKRRILRMLGTYAEIEPQKLNDPDGEVGYLLRFFPESLDLGAEIVSALKKVGIEAETRGPNAGPDWHLYSHIFPVVLGQGPTAENCPFECPIYRERGGEARYARGDCPTADDLFDRMVSIKLNQWYTEEDCRRAAASINGVLAAYCTESSDAEPWL